MPETYGAHECRAYYVVESTYGQTPTNPSMIGINAENVEPTLDPTLVKVRGVGSRDVAFIRGTVWKPSLKISHILPSNSPINFIQHASTLNSLSIQVLWYKGLFGSATDIISLLFKGMRIDKLTVECSLYDVVKASVELIGQNVSVSTSKISGATYTDYTGAVPSDESYVQRGYGDGSYLTPLERVTDWKFTIENNLKPVPVIRTTSGHLLKYLPARHRNLTGELALEFEDKQEFDDFIAEVEFSLKFGLGSTRYALFKYCKWENVTALTHIEDLVSVKARFVAKEVVLS